MKQAFRVDVRRKHPAVLHMPAKNMWRLFMLELTESACKELNAYFADKERGNIRIYLAPGG